MNIKIEHCEIPGPTNFLAFVECTQSMRQSLTDGQIEELPSAYGCCAKTALENLMIEIEESNIPFEIMMK